MGDWVGATIVKSVSYYEQIRKVLRPEGVFVNDGSFGSSEQRKANLAALYAAFDILAAHSTEVILASDTAVKFDPLRAQQVVRPSAPVLGQTSPTHRGSSTTSGSSLGRISMLSCPFATSGWASNTKRILCAGASVDPERSQKMMVSRMRIGTSGPALMIVT